MINQAILIELTAEEIKDNPFPKFYDIIASKLNYAITDAIRYNCTKINVAANIQTAWYQHYGKDASQELTMKLCMMGPKVDSELSDSTVEVLPGFISFEVDKSKISKSVFSALMTFLDAIPSEGRCGDLYGVDEMLNEDPDMTKDFELNIDENHTGMYPLTPRIYDVDVDLDKLQLSFAVCYEDPDADGILEEHNYILKLEEVK